MSPRDCAMILLTTALLCGGGWHVSSVVRAENPAFRFHDVTSETGIHFRHFDGSSGRYYIVEYVCAGVVLFDYDGDGDVDIYFLNGGLLPGAQAEAPPRNALYRNDGDWKFTDVTDEAQVGDTSHSLGATAGDYDNDGDLDLYVNNMGPNVLYRNNGDGTFSDVTEAAGVDNGNRVGAGAAFLDIEGDGDLDLYVANYVQFDYSNHKTRTLQGHLVYAGPLDYEPEGDSLYRNNGNGTFTDITDESGIASHKGPGMGMVCADYDNDADTDIFVGNDSWANFLWENDGHGHFKEIGLLTGFAYDRAGKVQGTMGVDCADYDNDGWLDIHVTSYQNELATLYRNTGRRLLDDVTIASGAGEGTRAPVTWGNGFGDFDNDGLRDLFIATGHLHDQIDSVDDRELYAPQNFIMRNLGRGKFANVTSTSGDGFAVKFSSRGAGLDDLDNDGDLDIVILNSRREPTLLRNDSSNSHHWLQLTLRGTRTNRDAVGAHVEVVSGPQRWVDEVHSGRGYQGHFGSRLHFGLGNRAAIDSIRVRWIGGKTEVWQGLPIDQHHTLLEGSGRVESP